MGDACVRVRVAVTTTGKEGEREGERKEKGDACAESPPSLALPMMQIAALCDHKAYDQSGAAVVAVIFLGVFVALILGDAVITAFALHKALTKDEREEELDAKIQSGETYLKKLNARIAAVKNGTLHNPYVRSTNSFPSLSQTPVPPPQPPSKTFTSR